MLTILRLALRNFVTAGVNLLNHALIYDNLKTGENHIIKVYGCYTINFLNTNSKFNYDSLVLHTIVNWLWKKNLIKSVKNKRELI